MNNEQVLQLTREIAGIGAMQTATLEAIRDVKQDVSGLKQDIASNYVTKAEHKAGMDATDREFETVEGRLSKLESAPARYVTTGIALIGVVLALLSYLHK